jgi:predicted Zn-dependent protease
MNHFCFFLFLCFLVWISVSCSERKPSADGAVEKQHLIEAFEAGWGIRNTRTDSVRYQLASLPGNDPYQLYCRAWKKAKEKQLSSALKTADSLVMGFPKFEKGIFLRANLRLENKDTSGSISDFERCLRKNPGFFEARMNRGSLYFQKNMVDLAYQDFREASRLKPGDANVGRNLGNTFLVLGKPDSACFHWSNSAMLGDTVSENLLQQYCSKKSK